MYAYNPIEASNFPLFRILLCEVSKFTIIGIERKLRFLSTNQTVWFASAKIRIIFNMLKLFMHHKTDRKVRREVPII